MAGEISIALGASTLVALLVAVLLAGAAVFFYRTTLPPLSPRRRWLFTLLRSAALVALALVFFEPALRLVRHEEQPPAVALLVDDSQSLDLRDAGGRRADALLGVLRSGGLGKFPDGTRILTYRFSGKLAPLGAVDSLDFAGEATNISAALTGLKEKIPARNIQAAVLLSDGNYTDGRSPVYDAEELGIPVYAVGVGDTAEQKDLVVYRMTTNAVVYAGTSVPVEAAFHSSGYDGERVEITLAEGAVIVDRATATLRAGVQAYTFRLHWTPS